MDIESKADYITCDGVQLHIGVVMGQRLMLGRRLEDWSQSRRRDVGNLQGQRGLVEVEKAQLYHIKSVLLKSKGKENGRSVYKDV